MRKPGLTLREQLRYLFARTYNRLPLLVRAFGFATYFTLSGERGAFAITNKVFATPDGMYMPSVHKELADQTTVGNTDLGVVGLKWFRIRIMVKSGMANGNTVIFTVRVGTGAGVTAPELILTSPTITFVTGDTNLFWEAIAASNAGFQSFKITFTNSGGAASADVMVDAA